MSIACLLGMSDGGFADESPGESLTGGGVPGTVKWREPVEFTRRSLELPGYVQPALGAADDKAVIAVAFSQDAKWMATGNAAGQVLLRRTGEPEVQQEMIGEHHTIVRGLQFLSGGKFLASLDVEGRLLLWSTSTGEKVQELAPIDQVLAIGVGSDDGRLIGLSEGTTLRVWEQEDDRWHETQEVSLEMPCSLLSVSRDANVAVVVSQPNVWQVHRFPASVVGQAEKKQAGDVVSEEPFTADSNGLNAISAVRVSPNGDRVALGWDDGSITVHLTADGSEKFRWWKHPNRVTNLCFSKTGKTLLSGCFRDRIRVWDLARGQHINDREVGLELVAAMELTDDPQRLVVAGAGPDVVVLDVQVPADRFVPAFARPRAWNNKAVHGVRFVPGKDEIAVVAKLGTIERVDLQGKRLQKATLLEPGRGKLVTAMVSPDGQFSARGYASGEVLVHRQGNGNPLWKSNLGSRVNALDISRDSKWLAVASGRNSVLRVMDLPTGREVSRTANLDEDIRRVRFDPDAATLLSNGHQGRLSDHIGVLTRWSVKDAKQLNRVQSPDIYSCVEVSPDGSRIVTGGMTGVVQLFDDQLRLLKTYEVGGRGGIHVLRLFDSKHLFVGTYKGSVLCIDLETGMELARLEPLPEHLLRPVRDIDYDAKTETLIAVGGYDGQESMRLYSLKEFFQTIDAVGVPVIETPPRLHQ
ncbi:WD-40 repeat protein [Rhodopirellula islandica]|uniref:WD-40 repeat protein n=1 Tax=Rhodopirellula islandica TaxID=595434 RepID=A0A0J1BKZ1_RHOIS|nr:WD40 repeat domain-containing protein [Rhodopirellula islandica]KLU07108.1 WD-40 repeat protein [Rhodopirellula islandica]